MQDNMMKFAAGYDTCDTVGGKPERYARDLPPESSLVIVGPTLITVPFVGETVVAMYRLYLRSYSARDLSVEELALPANLISRI